MLNDIDGMMPQEALLALRLLKTVPGISLAGVYLHGSAVMAGLRRDSDIDLLAVLGQGLSQTERKTLSEGLLAISGPPGDGRARPIELIAVCQADLVPWRYPPRREYLYGEWLRDRFRRGDIQGPAFDPDLTLILAQSLLYSVPLFGPELRDVLGPVPAADVQRAIRDSLPELLDHLRGDERNVLLTLARMWFTASGGEFASKDTAAIWAVNHGLSEDQGTLLRTAGQAYLGECEDNWEGLGGQAQNLARMMTREILSCLHVV